MVDRQSTVGSLHLLFEPSQHLHWSIRNSGADTIDANLVLSQIQSQTFR